MCFAVNLLASRAILAHPASEVRGTIGPRKARKLGNSTKTNTDVTIPSGMTVLFIAFTAAERRTWRCVDEWSDFSLR